MEELIRENPRPSVEEDKRRGSEIVARFCQFAQWTFLSEAVYSTIGQVCLQVFSSVCKHKMMIRLVHYRGTFCMLRIFYMKLHIFHNFQIKLKSQPFIGSFTGNFSQCSLEFRKSEIVSFKLRQLSPQLCYQDIHVNMKLIGNVSFS